MPVTLKVKRSQSDGLRGGFLGENKTGRACTYCGISGDHSGYVNPSLYCLHQTQQSRRPFIYGPSARDMYASSKYNNNDT